MFLLFHESAQRSNLAPVLEMGNYTLKFDVDQAWVTMEHTLTSREDNIGPTTSHKDERHWHGSSSGHKKMIYKNSRAMQRQVLWGSITWDSPESFSWEG